PVEPGPFVLCKRRFKQRHPAQCHQPQAAQQSTDSRLGHVLAPTGWTPRADAPAGSTDVFHVFHVSAHPLTLTERRGSCKPLPPTFNYNQGTSSIRRDHGTRSCHAI